MTFSLVPLVDARSAAFTRLASRVLETLNAAVEKRASSGKSRTQLADKIGWHRSQLTRILNGNVRNLTLRTISDILWATDFEPRDFEADPLEAICANCQTHAALEADYVQLFQSSNETRKLNFSSDINWIAHARPRVQQISLGHVPA